MLLNRTSASLYRLLSRNFALKFRPVDDKPIAFSKTDAAKWKAKFTQSGSKKDIPESRQWSLIFSLAVFFIYFFILREENDIDEILGRTPDETYADMKSKGFFPDGDHYLNKEGYRYYKR